MSLEEPSIKKVVCPETMSPRSSEYLSINPGVLSAGWGETALIPVDYEPHGVEVGKC